MDRQLPVVALVQELDLESVLEQPMTWSVTPGLQL
jgi:hypothetical protein